MKTKGKLYKSVIIGLVIIVTFTGVFAYMHFGKALSRVISLISYPRSSSLDL